MDASIRPDALLRALASDSLLQAQPLLIDVRRTPVFRQSTDLMAGALRRDPDDVQQWGPRLPPAATVVVYCVHGHAVSQTVAQHLRDAGLAAQFLEGGLDAWRAAGGMMQDKPAGRSSVWVTRERPKIDRIACPWLISRFIDRDAEFLYVPTPDVLQVATTTPAVPYDVPDVAYTHTGPLCSFDAFIGRHHLTGDPALAQLATIVRGADTGVPELAPECAGLLAVSLGLSRLFSDDHNLLNHGMVIYDALYRWCREGQDERHTWNPDPAR